MGISWVPYALVRVTVFFIFGILLYLHYPALSSDQALAASITLAFIYLFLWSIFKRRKFHAFNVVLSSSAFFTFFLLGYLGASLQDQKNHPGHLLSQGDIQAYRARIADQGQEKRSTHRFLAKVQSVRQHDEWKPATGILYLYLSKDMELPAYGDVLLIPGAPQEVAPPQNPGEFDYKRFLGFKNIYHQHFIRAGITKLSQGQGNAIIAFGYRLRLWAKDKFTRYLPRERERNIALALVLGVKDGLDNEVKNAYAASGAMHVLAVSGLHVGIIYLLVSFLLGTFQNKKYGRWVFALVSLSVLWTYAMVTGFAPSVLRAVTMFSFIALAKASGRRTNIYNTLAASALVLLVIDPYLVMSVGFQLSYLAVLGIVFLQPKIYAWLAVNNMILDKAWAVTSVSIAAQLATFPLGLFYFNQFPTLFLLTNLVVIPGALVILVGGIALLASSVFPVIAAVVGKLLQWVVWGVNLAVFSIEKLPASHISGIYVSSWQLWFIIIAVGSLVLYLVYRRLTLFTLLGSSAIALMISTGIQQYRSLSQQSLTFYKINGHTAIDLISQGRSTLWMDSTLAGNTSKVEFHITPNHLRSSVEDITVHTDFEPGPKGLQILVAHNKKIAVLGAIDRSLSFSQKPRVDFIVYGKKCQKDVSWIVSNFEFDLLLIDGSLYRYKADRVRKEAEELGLNFHSLYHNGAYQVLI